MINDGDDEDAAQRWMSVLPLKAWSLFSRGIKSTPNTPRFTSTGMRSEELEGEVPNIQRMVVELHEMFSG